ncbi:MAG: biotin--[acetyl-CoA-carboxylase] ligase [Desulfomonile tiedjei]|nr:biotin--[acetyl-CoA-carboxylase] ligase [Desulfomonile tiedjei]
MREPPKTSAELTGRLTIYQEAESTQDLAREMAVRGEPDGTAIMALNQTLGRGRAGHTWISPPGRNLALSVILRPRVAAKEAPLLGLAAAVAVAETVESRGVPRAELKWPNDVLVQGQKISGILSEASINSNTVEFVIIGIGLNVNSVKSDFPHDLRSSVTSLLTVTGRQSDLEEVARELLRALGHLYDRVQREGCGFVPDLWDARWAHRGLVLVHEEGSGIAEGIDADGSLLLRDDRGSLIRIASGDVEPTA